MVRVIQTERPERSDPYGGTEGSGELAVIGANCVGQPGTRFVGVCCERTRVGIARLAVAGLYKSVQEPSACSDKWYPRKPSVRALLDHRRGGSARRRSEGPEQPGAIFVGEKYDFTSWS